MELRLRNGKGQVPASTSYHAAMVAANEDSGSESTEPATRALQGRGKRRKRGRQLVKFREGGKRSRYNLRSPFEPGSKPSSSVVFHRRNSSLDSDRSYLVLEKATAATAELCQSPAPGPSRRVLRSNSSSGAMTTFARKVSRHNLQAHSGSIVVTAQDLLELGPFDDRVVEVRDGHGAILMTGTIRRGGLIEVHGTGKKRPKMLRCTEFEDKAAGRGTDGCCCDGVRPRGEAVYFANGQTLRDFVYAANSGFALGFSTEDLHRFTGATQRGDGSDSGASTLAKAVISYCQKNPAAVGASFRVRGGSKSHKRGGGGSTSPLSFSGNGKLAADGDACLCDACPQAIDLCGALNRLGVRTLRNGQHGRLTGVDLLCPECEGARRDAPSGGATMDAMDALTRGCGALLSELDRITGGCCLCHVPDFHRGAECESNTAIMCDQCEREFHVGCLRREKICDLRQIPKGKWFCSRECKGVNQALQRQRQLGLQRCRKGARDQGRAARYTYEVLCGEGKEARTRASLADALDILQQSFDPLPHAITGDDLLPIMAKAQTCADHDYTTVHTILLRCEGEAVCACVIRICGRFLAEIPFVATAERERGKGHCRQMFSVIDSLLSQLEVERYCLPAAAGQAMNTWIKHFNFRVMPDGEFRNAKADFRILLFPGTSLLVKDVVRSQGGRR